MQTLAEQRKLSNPDRADGVIDLVSTQDDFINKMPMKDVTEETFIYARTAEDFDPMQLVNAGINTNFTGINKDETPYTNHTAQLTSFAADVEMSGLDQALDPNGEKLKMAMSQKIKGIARSFSNMVINGSAGGGYADGDLFTPTMLSILNKVIGSTARASINTYAKRKATGLDSFIIESREGSELYPGGALTDGATLAEEALTAIGATAVNAAVDIVYGQKGFDGLRKMMASSENNFAFKQSADYGSRVPTGTDESDGIFYRLETYLNAVKGETKDKFIMLNATALPRLNKAIRNNAGGLTMQDITMSDGSVRAMNMFGNVPILINNYIDNEPVSTDTTNANEKSLASIGGGNKRRGFSSTDADTIYAGVFDDGSGNGICGIQPMGMKAGISFKELGARENKDSEITRVTFYAGLLLSSHLGLATGKI